MSDDNQKNMLIPIEITVDSIKAKIYEIRGQKVMLDHDLAEIYGYETKNFNRQVTNNSEKFAGDDFMFQLTKEEFEDLRCKNFTSSWGGTRYLPRAFTEQGVYMLMTVLKGDLATRQSRALVTAFKQMKDYLLENPTLIGQQEFLQLSLKTEENSKDIARIQRDMVTRDDLVKVVKSFSVSERGNEILILDGQTFEADVAYADIYGKASKTVFLVDNYIGPKTLQMLKSVKSGVQITIFSDNIRNMLRASEFAAFQSEYPSISVSFRHTGGKFHDRYIVLDYKTRSEKIYHCGASSKDAEKSITTIDRSDNAIIYHPMIDDLLTRSELVLK